MHIYGLTGGIASGKSSIARVFGELGAPVIDADILARAVVGPGSEALKEIVARFGEEVLQADGSLNRQSLGAIVFANKDARDALDKITHPRISAAAQDAIKVLADQGHAIAIYEAALIVENGLQAWMQGLIVVTVPTDVQLLRLMARDNLDEADARTRIDSQLPLADKIRVANHLIDNAGTPNETREQVVSLWKVLQEESKV